MVCLRMHACSYFVYLRKTLLSISRCIWMHACMHACQNPGPSLKTLTGHRADARSCRPWYWCLFGHPMWILSQRLVGGLIHTGIFSWGIRNSGIPSEKKLRACTCIKTCMHGLMEFKWEWTFAWTIYTCMGAAHCMQSYDFVELWAGTAWTTTMVRKSGRNTAALDIEYFQVDPQKPHRSNHFDIMTPSGFLFLGMSSCCFHWPLIPTNQWVSCFHEVPINNSRCISITYT